MRVPVLLLGCALAAPASAGSAADEIRQLETRQAQAWTQHDARAYAALFTADGEVVNVLGWWWHGREEIERKLTAAFAWVFRDSVMQISDVQVRLLAPDLALAHVRWTMDGAKSPAGSAPPPRAGIQMQVLRRQHGVWLIDAFQNTNAVPEAPFPSGPAPAQPPAADL